VKGKKKQAGHKRQPMKAIKPFIIPNFTIARMKARIDASVLMTTIILFTAATVLSFSTSQTNS
jgi:hypothetical protein